MADAVIKTLIRASALLLTALALTATGVGFAQQASAPATAPAAIKPLWKELSRPQQVALDPLAAEWDRMELARKQKWLDIANRYSSMKPDEQARVQERMRDWLKLTPEERRVARENYTLSKKIGKSQKASQWEQYQQLPDEAKKKLAADAATKKQVSNQVTNLPPKAQPKTVAPIKPAPAAPVVCPPGMAKNTNPAGPACVTVPAPVPAAAAPVAPATAPPSTIPAPGNPAVIVPNAVPNAK